MSDECRRLARPGEAGRGEMSDERWAPGGLGYGRRKGVSADFADGPDFEPGGYVTTEPRRTRRRRGKGRAIGGQRSAVSRMKSMLIRRCGRRSPSSRPHPLAAVATARRVAVVKGGTGSRCREGILGTARRRTVPTRASAPHRRRPLLYGRHGEPGARL